MGNNNKWGLYDPRSPRNVSPVTLYDSALDEMYINGVLADYAQVEMRHCSRRERYASSPLYVVPGTTTIGRKPTQYSRTVFSQVTTSPVDIRGINWYGGTRRIKSPLNTTDMTNVMNETKTGRFITPHGDPYGDVDFANALGRAITECLIKIGDNKVDLGVAVAELGKTTVHLATTATDLWKTISALRGKRWGELINILSKRSALHSRKINPGMTAAKYWLEYNYAWQPLLQDVYGAMELVKLKLKPALLVHANRTVSWPTTLRGKLVGYNWYNQNATYEGKVKTESTCRLTGQIDSTAMRLASAGLTNPASVLWELVPFSFVVDWSTPIGNYLQAATATRGLSFVWGSTTQRYFAQMRAEIGKTPDSWDGFWTYKLAQPGRAEVFKFGMQRLPLNSFPEPVLYAKSPFSSSHALSALALLRALL